MLIKDRLKEIALPGELLYLDNAMFADFIYNLIGYALLREEVRRDIRKARGTVK